MKIDFEGARLYVRPGSTDLRKGVTGLLAIIENEMHLDALSNSVFFFSNKSHKLLKIIFWNKTGFWLAQKTILFFHIISDGPVVERTSWIFLKAIKEM